MLISHIPMGQHHTLTMLSVSYMNATCSPVFRHQFGVVAGSCPPPLPPSSLSLSLSLSFSLPEEPLSVIFNKSQYTRLIEQQSNHNCLFLHSIHSHTFSQCSPFLWQLAVYSDRRPSSPHLLFSPSSFHLDSSIYRIN